MEQYLFTYLSPDMFCSLTQLGEKSIFLVWYTQLTLPYTPKLPGSSLSALGKHLQWKWFPVSRKTNLSLPQRQRGVWEQPFLAFVLLAGELEAREKLLTISLPFPLQLVSFLPATPSTTRLHRPPFCPFIPFSSPLVSGHRQSESSNVPPMSGEKF